MAEYKCKLGNELTGIENAFHCTTLITYDEYLKFYKTYHTMLAQYCKEPIKDESFLKEETDLMEKLLDSELPKYPEIKKNIIDSILKSASAPNFVGFFIKIYTEESSFCYALNMLLRKCDYKVYIKLKYFAGILIYVFQQYAKTDPSFALNKNAKLYRRLCMRLIDVNSYRAHMNELICFPAFTSTSCKDQENFPTDMAKQINISANQVVLMKIDYKCKPGCLFDAVNVSKFSQNPGEEEYLFLPFSFFTILNVVMGEGTQQNPHIIHLRNVAKKELVEPALVAGKSLIYDQYKCEMIIK